MKNTISYIDIYIYYIIYIYLAQIITTSSHGLVTFEMVVNSKVNPLQNPPKQLKLRDFFPTICQDTYTKVQTP